MLSTIKNFKTFLLASAMVMILPTSNLMAADLNVPGFTGTVNTTITSGFSVRSSDRNCMIQDGFTYNVDSSKLSAAGQFLLATETDITAAQALNGFDKNAKTSGSCAGFQTDGYGNTSTNRIEYGSVNADDGNLNFDRGDVIDATQKAFVEISGTHESGVGVGLSFIGSYNPVMNITDENFRALTSAAEDELESDIALLDAYVTTSFDGGEGLGFVDVTAGRYVTSWGEATFIPVGLNGLVTNALDLSKLRAPGASIRDALLPTEQLTVAFGAGNVGFEVYTQFNSDSVTVDPKGSFFGSDIVGTGGDRILASGAYAEEVGDEAYCPYAAILQGFTCNAALKAITLAPATRHLFNDSYNSLAGYRNATATQWATWAGIGRTAGHGQAFQSLVDDNPLLGGAQFVQVENTLAAFTSTTANAVKLPIVYGGVKDADFTKAATVELLQWDQKEAKARDDGQWGVRASTYLDDLGTGVDLGFYYANYHSKVPYIQMMGKSGVMAGDIIGAMTHVFYDFAGVAAAGGGNPGVMDAAINTGTGATAANHLLVPFLNGAYGSGVCGGLGAALGGSAVQGDVDSQAAKLFLQNVNYKKVIDGELVHDPSNCSSKNNLNDTDYQSIFLSLTPTLAAAVTPLNYARYQFIYPEDNQVMGVSFSTNVGGTVLQGEVAYRPNFPLATAAGDQINQIADASGTTLALTAFGHDTYALSPSNVLPGLTVAATINTLNGAGLISKDFGTLLKASKRSSLPVIDPSLVKVYDATTYYRSTPFIKYDTVSVDLGTTTSFAASHPITKGLGADSAVFLTEVAMVQIDDLDNITNGFVARGGFNEGSGEHLCLGIFNGLSGDEIAAVNTALASTAVDADVRIDNDMSAAGGVTNVGASIVDAIFGNGSYCESQMGADERAFSYRLVGSARYDNFNNSAWSLSPSLVWSHDPRGYGPSSLGGFTEGRQSVSLSLTANRGDALSTSISYVDQLGDDKANLRNDMDYVSASVSYAF